MVFMKIYIKIDLVGIINLGTDGGWHHQGRAPGPLPGSRGAPEDGLAEAAYLPGGRHGPELGSVDASWPRTSGSFEYTLAPSKAWSDVLRSLTYFARIWRDFFNKSLPSHTIS